MRRKGRGTEERSSRGERSHKDSPKVHVKHVNIARPQPLQTLPNTQVHTLDSISHGVDVLLLPIIEPAVLCGDDESVPVPPLFHPLADPFLRFAKVVQVGRVDKVSAGFDEGVEEFKGGFFGDLSGHVYGAQIDRYTYMSATQ
jgi:hypothetical protein